MEAVKNINVLISQIQAMGNAFKAFKDTESLLKVLNSYLTTCSDLEIQIASKQEILAAVELDIANCRERVQKAASDAQEAEISADKLITAYKDSVAAQLADLNQKVVEATEKANVRIAETEAAAREKIKGIDNALQKHVSDVQVQVTGLNKEITNLQKHVTDLETQEKEAACKLEEAKSRLAVFVSTLGVK